MRGSAKLWMAAAAVLSLIYSQQATEAGETKPAMMMAYNDTGSPQTLIGFSQVFGEQIAQVSDHILSPDFVGALRTKNAAIRRICRLLRPETRDLLLSCR